MKMNKLELKEMTELHRERLRNLESITTHCPSCKYFGVRGMCDKWGAQVPADVQPVGCADWIYDEIPF